MKRSVSITLGLVVTLGTARSQQGADPCDEATFNAKACHAAVRSGAYCSNGSRVKMTYQQSYPYYYDRYRNYVAGGGAVNSVPAQACPGRFASSTVRGGFGTTAVSHHAGS